ncbi:MAG: glycosyltransferase [Zoogloeaceae bacterium]|jgi:glycosyltransferase involved in cell wall biosynthesis|nr:glycosyltransferase [Zoogloeaceae bacterium]
MSVTNQPLVSVVVPVYGTASFLPACLDSLLGQTLADIEIITVNDASPDESQAIIERYASQDARVKLLINHENQNAYETRRRGFAAASGLYIATCDSDDSLPLTALEALYKTAQKTGADLVHGQMREFVAGKNLISAPHSSSFLASDGRSYILSFLRFCRGWSACGKLYHRRVVEKALKSLPVGLHLHVLDDLLYAYFLGLATQKYAPLSEVVYHYRVAHGNFFSIPERCLTNIADAFAVFAILKDHIAQNSANAGYDFWLRLLIRQHIVKVFAYLPGSVDAALAREIISEKLGAEYLASLYADRPSPFSADKSPTTHSYAFQPRSFFSLVNRFFSRRDRGIPLKSGIYEFFICVRYLISLFGNRGCRHAIEKVVKLLKSSS